MSADDVLMVRLTSAEKERLRASAERAGVSMSEYVRAQALVPTGVVCSVDVQIHAVSRTNSRAAWVERARKTKQERLVTAAALLTARGRECVLKARESIGYGRPDSPSRASIRLVRVGVKRLDDDNVREALKAVRDEFAAAVGVDDGDKRWDWQYSQENGPYCVRIEVLG